MPDLLAELLRAAAQRDQVAFAELYRLTSGKLYGVARRMFAGQADPATEATVKGRDVHLGSRSGRTPIQMSCVNNSSWTRRLCFSIRSA